jgi:hypothetical protein
LRHFNFLIRIFVRHDYGALERARSPIFASDLRSLGGIVGLVAERDAPFGEEVQRFENPGGAVAISVLRRDHEHVAGGHWLPLHPRLIGSVVSASEVHFQTVSDHMAEIYQSISEGSATDNDVDADQRAAEDIQARLLGS